jgi:hypothetical protein
VRNIFNKSWRVAKLWGFLPGSTLSSSGCSVSAAEPEQIKLNRKGNAIDWLQFLAKALVKETKLDFIFLYVEQHWSKTNIQCCKSGKIVVTNPKRQHNTYIRFCQSAFPAIPASYKKSVHCLPVVLSKKTPNSGSMRLIWSISWFWFLYLRSC